MPAPNSCLPSTRSSRESRSSVPDSRGMDSRGPAGRGFLRRPAATKCSSARTRPPCWMVSLVLRQPRSRPGVPPIVVTTSPHRAMLHQRLQACGLDVDLAIEEGRYVWLDVADALSAIMVDGWPDEARFWKATTALVAAAARASTCTPARVAACGECAPSLWREGSAAAAIRLEHLWDELARAHDVDVLCGYSLNAPLHDEEHRIFQRICAEHSAVHSRWRRPVEARASRSKRCTSVNPGATPRLRFD